MTPDAGSLVVETAGGLHSPLADALTNADLALRLLPAHVVLVAPDRIGVLHDVRACTLAAQARSLRVSAVVLSAPATLDASSGTNGRELEVLGLGPVAASFPRAPFETPESIAAAERVWEGLLRSRLQQP
jgi:dethiobiotin synthetase